MFVAFRGLHETVQVAIATGVLAMITGIVVAIINIRVIENIYI